MSTHQFRPGEQGGDPMEGSGQTLAVHRPQTNREWLAWHARRDQARRVIAKVCVVDSLGFIDEAATDAACDTLLLALGLDRESEAELINRWA